MANGWTVLDEKVPLLTRAYVFRPGAEARMAVAGIGNGKLLAISPASGIGAEGLRALDAFGKVTAIIAPNGFHYLGIPEWRRAFPEARVFAPEKAKKRIAKKVTAGEIRPLSELGAELPTSVRVVEVPFMKLGETWLEVDTASGPFWYVSDSLFNMKALPDHWLFGRIFKWTKSGPGLSFNGIGALFFLSDKKGYKKWLLQRLANGGPAALISAHGDVVVEPGLGDRLRKMAEQRF
jgi:hypothetical protein